MFLKIAIMHVYRTFQLKGLLDWYSASEWMPLILQHCLSVRMETVGVSPLLDTLRNLIGDQLWCHRFPQGLIILSRKFPFPKNILHYTPGSRKDALPNQNINVCPLRKYVCRPSSFCSLKNAFCYYPMTTSRSKLLRFLDTICP